MACGSRSDQRLTEESRVEEGVPITLCFSAGCHWRLASVDWIIAELFRFPIVQDPAEIARGMGHRLLFVFDDLRNPRLLIQSVLEL